ncbi:uncharacterized protein [Triticum aestivum]|uniref:uncharacterized protein n=1 Tax=Triticum aestivum TaxID=4565 RepID=UPI001D008B41|nr:uncharacterized protein LOC123149671 [Triticum aestivum]
MVGGCSRESQHPRFIKGHLVHWRSERRTKHPDRDNADGDPVVLLGDPGLKSLERLGLSYCDFHVIPTGCAASILISPTTSHICVFWYEDTPYKPAATFGQPPVGIHRCPLLWK